MLHVRLRKRIMPTLQRHRRSAAAFGQTVRSTHGSTGLPAKCALQTNSSNNFALQSANCLDCTKPPQGGARKMYKAVATPAASNIFILIRTQDSWALRKNYSNYLSKGCKQAVNKIFCDKIFHPVGLKMDVH